MYQRINLGDHRRISWLENLDASDHWTRFAIKEIENTYGDKVSVDKKKKSLLKFGRTTAAGGAVPVSVSTIGSGQVFEQYASTNTITHFASSSTADVGTIVVEGHTVDSDDNLSFVVQTATLVGQTKTALTTPLTRCTRVYNTSTADWSGNVYVASNSTFTTGIPESTSIYAVGISSENQSLKGETSFSYLDYAIVSTIYASISSKQAASGLIRFQTRDRGGVFRTQWSSQIGSASNNSVAFSPRPYLLVPANGDVRLTVESSGSNLEVNGGFNCQLAIVT